MEALQTLGIDNDMSAEMLSNCFSNMSLLDEKAFGQKILDDEGNNQIEDLFQKKFISAKVVFSDTTQILHRIKVSLHIVHYCNL